MVQKRKVKARQATEDLCVFNVDTTFHRFLNVMHHLVWTRELTASSLHMTCLTALELFGSTTALTPAVNLEGSYAPHYMTSSSADIIS